MYIRRLLSRLKRIPFIFLFVLLLFPLPLYASFIESTMGVAVVNDATAVYYNPAALALLKNSQWVALNSAGYLRSEFSGQAIHAGFIQSGTSITKTRYYLPTFYYAIPIKNKFTIGLAAVSNFFNKDIDGNSPLRYAQSNNNIKDIDLVPALEFKLNKFFSIGAGMDISYAKFLLKPISGFPSLNIPDSQSRNEVEAKGLGADVGFLLKPNKSTIIGFNYRSAITYRFRGKSVLESVPEVVSNHYGFTFWTPARYTLSMDQLITRGLGIIATVQRIKWSIFKEINIHGIATQIGTRPAILNAKVPFYLRDTWLLTLGSHYQVTPKWIIRIAGSYNQSSSNANFQISNGDSIILGASTSYDISKNFTIDGGYAHAFIQNKNIHIITSSNQINGRNKGSVDSVSLKLIFKFK